VASTEPHAIGVVHHPRRKHQTASTLLVLLPGVNIRAEDFVAHDFVSTLQAREDSVDLLIAEPDLDFYLDGTILRRLETCLAEEATGYRRLWLSGVSLGALGALLVAAGGRVSVDGLLLLAPFIGTPGLIAEIERAGGFPAWQPGEIARNDGERRVCAWLKTYIETQAGRPILQLGCGICDRFAAASRLLAAGLPPARCHVADGGHDWPTWKTLWTSILDARPFIET
jgi:pimeloyl-ACP methyl ester carboxylesterase